MKTSKPKVTTMCMNSFFFSLNLTVKTANNRIGKPKKDGINEVKESLLLIKLIDTPQIIKKKTIKNGNIFHAMT